MDGTAIKTDDGGYLLTFERHFDHPIDKVWKAISDPSELTKWIAGDEAVVEPRVGGRVHMSGHGGIEATLLAFEAPRVIEYEWKTSEWDGGPIRWELSETPQGTKLTFTHAFPQPDMAEQEEMMKKMGFGPDMYDPIPRTLAGWHSLIDDLGNALDGKEQTEQGRPTPAWKQLHESYKKRYATTGS